MKNNENNSSFWVAYADLMAGLAFIFILLIGIIVVKYVLSQSYLNDMKVKLETEKQALTQSRIDLSKKEEIVDELSSKLQRAYNDLQNEQKKKKELENTLSEHSKNEKLLTQTYIKTSQELEKTLVKLDKILGTVDEQDQKIIVLLDEIKKKDLQIKEIENKYELDRVKIDEILDKNIVLIARLQEKLKDVSIDSSGTLVLSSNVLFDKESYRLKHDFKDNLEGMLKNYFNTILNDDEIYNSIESIIIEGHTDSDGSYIYNLELSQKRAYEVMNFIYSFNSDKRLQKLLMASGRSYSAPIMKDGKEDKEASRRIEIKIVFSRKTLDKDIRDYFKNTRVKI